MTRTVTLADLAPARATTAAKATTENGAQQASSSGDGSSFAQMLHDADSLRHKAPTKDGDEDRHESQRETVTSPACPITVPVLPVPDPVGARSPEPASSTSSAAPTVRAEGSTASESQRVERSDARALVADPAGNKPAPAETTAEALATAYVRSMAADRLGQAEVAEPSKAEAHIAGSEVAQGETVGQPTGADTLVRPSSPDTGANETEPSPAPRPDGPTQWATDFPSRLAVIGSRVQDEPPAPRSEQHGQGVAKNGVPSAPVRPQSTLAAIEDQVSNPPALPPVSSTSTGEFAAHLDKVGSDTADMQPRSDFLASNGGLTASLSRLQNEGNGVYSVTALLNPPSLGHVQAVVRVDGTTANISLVAHSPEGHKAIAGHLDELVHELQTQGGDVQLSLSDGGSRGRQQDETASAPALVEDLDEADSPLLSVVTPNTGNSLHVIL